MESAKTQPPVTEESDSLIQMVNRLPIPDRELPPLIREVVQNAPKSRKVYLFMADYILNSLIKRWGKTFEDLNTKRINDNNPKHNPGIFALLGQDFSRDQLKALIKEQGKTTPARMFIYMWTKQGDIIAIDNDHFRKTKTEVK